MSMKRYLEGQQSQIPFDYEVKDESDGDNDVRP